MAAGRYIAVVDANLIGTSRSRSIRKNRPIFCCIGDVEKNKGLKFFNFKPLEFGAPGRIRTRDPLVRSPVLYPTELPARERGIMQNNSSFVNVYFSNGGEGGIRTPEARFMSLHP